MIYRLSYLNDIYVFNDTSEITMNLQRRHVFLFLAVLLFRVSLCLGQAGKAELFGVVADASGLPVPQATVKLEESATGATQTMTSSGQGEFHFFGLPQGNYRLSAEKPGFRARRQGGLVLRVADRVSLDIRLEVGDVVQTVEVTAAAPLLLQATTGTVSLVVEQRKVVTLPLDGRNFIPLLALSPGFQKTRLSPR